MKPFSIIVAMDEARGIGKRGGLAWHLPSDLKHFKQLTSAVVDPLKHNAVVMGRKTWESLPDKFRPLPGRLNVILTKQADFDLPQGVLGYDHIEVMLKDLARRPEIEKVFVIGGAELYASAVKHPCCQEILLTQVRGQYSCDVFFPSLPQRFKLTCKGPVLSENDQDYQFIQYTAV